MNALLKLVSNCKYGVELETDQYIEQVKQCINQITDENINQTILSRALEKRLYTTVELLLQYGFDPNSNMYENSQNHIEFASEYGDNKMIELLIKYNVNLNLNNNLYKCLYSAVKHLKYDTVKLLLNKYNKINIKVKLINVAIKTKYSNNKHLKFKIVKLLLKYINKLDLQTESVFITYNATVHCINCLPYLIRQGLNINHCDFKHDNILDFLVQLSYKKDTVRQIKTVLKLGAKLNFKDVAIHLPIHNREEIINLLESWWSDPVLSLYRITLRMILIHEVDTTSVPKSVLNQ